jgi:hypothetical protein
MLALIVCKFAPGRGLDLSRRVFMELINCSMQSTKASNNSHFAVIRRHRVSTDDKVRSLALLRNPNAAIRVNCGPCVLCYKMRMRTVGIGIASFVLGMLCCACLFGSLNLHASAVWAWHNVTLTRKSKLVPCDGEASNVTQKRNLHSQESLPNKIENGID